MSFCTHTDDDLKPEVQDQVDDLLRQVVALLENPHSYTKEITCLAP